MFNLFKPEEPKELYFFSYRNIQSGGKYPNYELRPKLKECLTQNGRKCDDILTIPPEAVPPDTLFTPYSVAKFLHEMFNQLDSIDHFIILNKDYFNEHGEPTSIWTHAEYLMWSYYDRNMFLGRYKRKDKFYIVATPDHRNSSGFHLTEANLVALEDFDRDLLRRASMDFKPFPGAPASLAYSEFAYYYVLPCKNCRTSNLLAKQTVQKFVKENKKGYCHTCRNSFTLKKVGEHFVANQKQSSTQANEINRVHRDITFTLELLFKNSSKFPIIDY